MRSGISIILVGKCGSCRRFSSGFSKNIAVAKTSCQKLEVSSFCDQEKAQPPLIKITVLTFLVKKKYNEAFRGVYFFRIHEKINVNSRFVGVLVIESKDL